MKRKIYIILSLLILSTYVFCQDWPKDFPIIENWENDNIVEVFQAKNLFDHLNGGAPFYIENEFKELHLHKYKQREKIIKVEIYKFKNSSNSDVIFDNEKANNVDISEIGSKGYTIGNNILIYKSMNYYIKVFSNSDSEDIKKAIIKVGTSINEKIAEGY